MNSTTIIQPCVCEEQSYTAYNAILILSLIINFIVLLLLFLCGYRIRSFGRYEKRSSQTVNYINSVNSAAIRYKPTTSTIPQYTQPKIVKPRSSNSYKYNKNEDIV